MTSTSLHGGTTGHAKGVLWRQHDIVHLRDGRRGRRRGARVHRVVANAASAGAMRVMPAGPFMHGAGHWIAFLAMNAVTRS